MIGIEETYKGFKTAEGRWARFGPYYAMFPLEFAFEVVDKYSKKGDYIIDPFAGRCSSIYAGGVLERNSLGIEINGDSARRALSKWAYKNKPEWKKIPDA